MLRIPVVPNKCKNIRKKAPERKLESPKRDSNTEKVKAPKDDHKVANDKNTSNQKKEAKAPVEKPVRALNDPRYKS